MRLIPSLALTAVAYGIFCIVVSWGENSATFDEPYHLAAGMEVLQYGRYTYEPKHPPLLRVFIASIPYAMGLRGAHHDKPTAEGNHILLRNGKYSYNLKLARAGVVPFYLFGCYVAWLWGTLFGSGMIGSLSVVLYALNPSVIAHSSVATLDQGAGSLLGFALYCLIRLSKECSVFWSITFGFASALSILAKFSNIAFLGTTFIAYLAWHAFRRTYAAPASASIPVYHKPRLRNYVIAFIAATITLWGGYGFQLDSISQSRGEHPSLDPVLTNPYVRHVAYQVLEAEIIPFKNLLVGLRQLYIHNKGGHDSYLLGQYGNSGWWHFFLVVLALKTPITLWCLSALGATTLALSRSPISRPAGLFALLSVVCVITVASAGRIHLGVRHILFVYIALSALAAFGVAKAFAGRSLLAYTLGLASLTLFSIETRTAAPDYLSYFNFLASSDPSKFLVESDLDWGQDLFRLDKALRDNRIECLSIAYFGTAPLSLLELRSLNVLDGSQRPIGYVAVSMRHLRLECAKSGAFCWLNEHQPFAAVGRTMLLFKF